VQRNRILILLLFAQKVGVIHSMIPINIDGGTVHDFSSVIASIIDISCFPFRVFKSFSIILKVNIIELDCIIRGILVTIPYFFKDYVGYSILFIFTIVILFNRNIKGNLTSS